MNSSQKATRKLIRKKLQPVDTKHGHKIAIYIRVSTEEQAENPEGSIKSQEQRLRTHVQLKNMESNYGEIVGVYIDRAKSGKNTNRPELQRMLQAIVQQEVTLVMVTELSRLSRSIKDFCEIWDLMRAHDCQFQSLREQFDTTSAAGEMVLYTIANIAQFERRQVSERVTANLQARSARGLYNGGVIPVGYTLSADKKGWLIIDPEQADIVRKAFKKFLEIESVTETAKWLNTNGYRMKTQTDGGGNRARLSYFTLGNLSAILRNKAYIAVKVYKAKDTYKEVPAVWHPILDENTFERAQSLLLKLQRKKPDSEHRYPYLLAGLVDCATCGDRLCGKSAHGNAGKIAYYEHSWATRKQSYLVKNILSCTPHRISAKTLEPIIWAKVEELLKNPGIAEGLIRDAQVAYESQNHQIEIKKIKDKVLALTSQIDALTERLAQLPKSISAASIFKQMEKIEELRQLEQAKIDTLEREHGGTEFPVSYTSYTAFLKGLHHLTHRPDSIPHRARIIQKLIKQIEVKPDGLRVHYYVGKTRIEGELAQASSSASLKRQRDYSNFFLVPGSNKLTSGAPTRTRTWDHPVMSRKL